MSGFTTTTDAGEEGAPGAQYTVPSGLCPLPFPSSLSLSAPVWDISKKVVGWDGTYDFLCPNLLLNSDWPLPLQGLF
jgi:hypothetical protein